MKTSRERKAYLKNRSISNSLREIPEYRDFHAYCISHGVTVRAQVRIMIKTWLIKNHAPFDFFRGIDDCYTVFQREVMTRGSNMRETLQTMIKKMLR